MSFTAFQENSLSSTRNYTTDNLPELEIGSILETFEQRKLSYGETLSIVELGPDAIDAILEMYQAERNNPRNKDKNYLLDRNAVAIARMFAKGNVIASLIDGKLAAIGAVTRIADIEDMGRGLVYTDNGNCKPDQQIYFKSALVHPDVQNGKLGLMPIMYPHRLAKAVSMEGRTCILSKTNNPVVKKTFIETYEWNKADSFELENNEGILDTYKISTAEAIEQLRDKYPSVYSYHKLNIMKAHGHMMFSNDNNVLTYQAPQQLMAARPL